MDKENNEHKQIEGIDRVATDALPATIIEIRPKALYRARLADGRVVTVGVESKLRHAIVRIFENQQVFVRLSSRDPHRGSIVSVAPPQKNQQ